MLKSHLGEPAPQRGPLTYISTAPKKNKKFYKSHCQAFLLS